MLRWLFRLLLGCSHDWKLVVECELPSRGEVLGKLGISVSSVLNASFRDTNSAAMEFSKKGIVSVLTCAKCGSIATKTFTN